jgi:hypothetical protein
MSMPNQPGNPSDEPPWGGQPQGYGSPPNPRLPPPSGNPCLFGFPVLLGAAIWGIVDATMMFAGSVKDNYGRKLR